MSDKDRIKPSKIRQNKILQFHKNNPQGGKKLFSILRARKLLLVWLIRNEELSSTFLSIDNSTFVDGGTKNFVEIEVYYINILTYFWKHIIYDSKRSDEGFRMVSFFINQICIKVGFVIKLL